MDWEGLEKAIGGTRWQDAQAFDVGVEDHVLQVERFVDEHVDEPLLVIELEHAADVWLRDIRIHEQYGVVELLHDAEREVEARGCLGWFPARTAHQLRRVASLQAPHLGIKPQVEQPTP